MKSNQNIKKIAIFSSIAMVIVASITLFSFKDKIPVLLNHDNEDKNNISNDDVDDNIKISPLVLKDYKITEGEEYDINSFIKSYSKNYSLNFENEQMANYTEPSNYKIRIVGINDAGEKVVEEAILRIDTKETAETVDKQLSTDKDNTEDNSDTKENNEKTSETKQDNQNLNKPENNNIQSQIPSQEHTETNNMPTKINSTTETSEEYSYQYGTTIKKTTYFYYDIYSDGSKVLTDSYDDYSYDYSTFSATTNDLKSEASLLASQNSSTINSVLNYVNQYRNEVSVQPLVLDQSLTVAAEIRALEMGWANYFSHTRPNGTSCFSVVDELGISYYAIGENIASGYWDAASVSNGWRNSPGHYANMVSSDFSKIGIGVANVNGTYYWVQLFTN